MLNFCNSLLRPWEARALILLRSHLNGRDGQKAGRLFISGCIDRDGGWQIEHNSRILLILLSLFSKEEWRCVLFSSWKTALFFKSIIEVCQSRVSHLCAALNNSQKVGGKIRREFLIKYKKDRKMKIKVFSLSIYFEFIHLANLKILLLT